MTTPHTTRAHARLAPSATHRWVECPGSVRLSENIPSKSSTYAAEGTAAHELAAHCLANDLDPAPFLGSVIDISASGPGAMFGNRVLTDGVTRFEVTDEMVDGVRLYLDAVRSLFGREKDVEVEVEQRLDMRHIHPEIFGTGDAVVYQNKTCWLHVVDFKYGKGVAVEPEENPQLMLYGAGAAKRYHNRRLSGMTLHIVQPRAPHHHGPVRSWQTDPFTLMEFEADIAAAAARTEAPDAPLNAGDWCRFCPALATCPAAREKSLKTALADFAEPQEPSVMSGEQIAAALREAEFIGNWVKAVQEFAHAEAIAGRPPPGFKLVAKRATRRWKDEVEARDRLMLECDMALDEMMSEPEMLSPAQIEKKVGRKAFAAIEGDLVVKQSSGTNLVPESDPRPVVKSDGVGEFAEP